MSKGEFALALVLTENPTVSELVFFDESLSGGYGS